jgi:tetratricopeptide (TPR) repeat protein
MILEKLFPQGHFGLAAVNLNLAVLYLQRGQEPDALQSIGKCLAEYKRLFPANRYKKSHPGLIHALTSLGDTLDRVGRHRDALPLHAEAWENCNKHYETRPHPVKLATLLSYGRCLRSLGRIDEATARFQQALDMARRLYPQRDYPGRHRELALCLLHIGSIQGRQRHYEAARASFERARAIYRRSYPQGHPFLSAISQYLGVAELLQSPAMFAWSYKRAGGDCVLASDWTCLSCGSRRSWAWCNSIRASRSSHADCGFRCRAHGCAADHGRSAHRRDRSGR